MIGPSPCKNCASRSRSCHANCNDYHDWKRRWIEYRNHINRKKHDVENYHMVTKKNRERER